MTPPPIRVLARDDADAIVDVLCDAFADYPVTRFVLGTAGERYAAQLLVLIRLFVMARVLRREPLLGIAPDGDLAAVALLSHPADTTRPSEFAALRDATWSELGEDALARYDAFGAATGAFPFPDPHLHLNMLGVRRAAQGRGLGRRLLEHVQRVTRDGRRTRGVSLTTELASNVELYRHVGYAVIGHTRVAPTLETWGMFRPAP